MSVSTQTLHHNQCSTFVTVTIADTAPPSLDPTAMVNMRSLLVILIYQLLFEKEHELALLIQYINLFLMLIYLSHTNILSLHWIFTLFQSMCQKPYHIQIGRKL